MTKQILLPLIGVVLFLLLIGLFVKKFSNFNTPKASPVAQTEQKSMTVGSKLVKIDLANTESLRQKGLGGRTSLPADSGMLFIFETKQVSPIFWMKDMFIPIDIIWISGGKVVQINKNVPAPTAGQTDDMLPKIYPNQPVDYVLEVNASFADNYGIKIGDSVDISKI